MLNHTTYPAKWSAAILWKFRWKNPDELFQFLEKADNSVIARFNLGTKRELIGRLERAIAHVEAGGDQNKETRAMTAPGALFESLSFEYLQIRANYMKKRMRLKMLLQAIGKKPTV